jgi:TPR repeat protein
MDAQAPSSDLQKLDLADQLLQEGIQHHQANRLKEAAVAFERSATTPGGSGVGMLMWGLTLRHGWGCAKNESLGFTWLRRAAEAAVGDLERARSGFETSAVRGELVLAIYEVGQCFFHGWGVKKDQKMAVVSCWICLSSAVRFQAQLKLAWSVL